MALSLRLKVAQLLAANGVDPRVLDERQSAGSSANSAPQAIAAQLSGFSAGVVKGLSLSQIMALMPAQTDEVMMTELGDMSATEPRSLDAPGLQALNAVQLSAHGATAIDAILMTALESLSATQLSSLSAARPETLMMGIVSAAQVNGLTMAQILALIATQVGRTNTVERRASSGARGGTLPVTPITRDGKPRQGNTAPKDRRRVQIVRAQFQADENMGDEFDQEEE